MRYVYLHGFASGPQSGKAQYFRVKLRDEFGIELQIPDLAEGDFEHLTISKQLAVIERVVAGEPSVLFGSSMGGYLAALSAAAHPDLVTSLVLLAPAFWFAHRWPDKLGEEAMSQWERTGSREFFHYGFNKPKHVGWELIADGLRYPGAPDFQQPALIFHGLADDVVPPSFSQEFAESHPNVTLHLLPSDHQLTDQVEFIWQEAKRFLFGL